MKFADATNLDRKSGAAQWRDLLFLSIRSDGSQQKFRLCRTLALVEGDGESQPDSKGQPDSL
jgi:hypothetical protein